MASDWGTSLAVLRPAGSSTLRYVRGDGVIHCLLTSARPSVEAQNMWHMGNRFIGSAKGADFIVA